MHPGWVALVWFAAVLFLVAFVLLFNFWDERRRRFELVLIHHDTLVNGELWYAQNALNYKLRKRAFVLKCKPALNPKTPVSHFGVEALPREFYCVASCLRHSQTLSSAT